MSSRLNSLTAEQNFKSYHDMSKESMYIIVTLGKFRPDVDKMNSNELQLQKMSSYALFWNDLEVTISQLSTGLKSGNMLKNPSLSDDLFKWLDIR